ncbi:unnamed protein product [Mytilus edulis]|uniref:DZIP3-like HEPN domain-containing protein n=1 Tax=Mytilus edulis TaxID=6550 RepID=A0A8S3RTU5_MYTED|nr:unnamed protein product [Mytilus edulis]
MHLINILEGLVHILKGKFSNMRTHLVFCSMCTLLLLLSAITVYKLVELPLDLNASIIITTTLIIGTFVLLLTRHRTPWANHRRIDNTKSRKFLQLMKLSMDISTEVLRKVVDSRILTLYGGSLEKFLDDNKHFLYHQWQGSTPCCECLPAGCTMVKSKNSRNGYLKISLRITELRIEGMLKRYYNSVFYFGTFCPPSSKERSALGDVVSTRNALCHARKTSCFDSKELENMWILLRDASLTLTDLPYRKLLKDQIDMLKKVEFDNSDIEILREKFEHEDTMLAEIYDFVNQNNITLKETGDIIVSHIDTTKRC